MRNGRVSGCRAGHSFGYTGLDRHRREERLWDACLRNRKNRGVLEPGGLNVERVRALHHGDGSLVPGNIAPRESN